MKKHLFVLIILALLVINCFAGNCKEWNKIHSKKILETTQEDTLKYLQDNFITHKEKFLHQSLNTILSQLHLKVKSYKNISPNKLQDTTTKGITLFFEDYRTTSEKLHAQKRVFFLDVYFEDKVSARRSLGLFTKTWGAWLDDQKNFYGKFLVKDIVGHK